MRATGSHDLHLDVTVAAGALLGGVEGLALLVAQLMPHWLVASYAAVYVGVAQAAVDAAVAHVNERGLGKLPAVRARIGRADAAVAAARLAVTEAARRVDAAPGDRGDQSLGLAGQAARRYHRGRGRGDRCSKRPGRRRRAVAIRSNGSTATPAAARCSRPPPTCAPTGSGVAALGGDPDSDGTAPRW